MFDRCENPRNQNYLNYGGRGIDVCDRWRGPHGFERFYADMGPRPSPRHSIDRVWNDGWYEPSNCRWATPKEQMKNRRATAAVLASARKANRASVRAALRRGCR